jgi:hypothetical protein
MELSCWFVIVPLAYLAFLTGLVLSLGTPWGCSSTTGSSLTTLSLVVLLLHMPSVSTLAGLARRADDADASRQGGDVLHPAVGLLVLIVVTVLNVHKPAASPPMGCTSKPRNRRAAPEIAPPPPDRRPKDQTPRPVELGLLRRHEDLVSQRETRRRSAFVLGPSLRTCQVRVERAE